MRHWVTYPITAHPAAPELLTKEALVRYAQAAEAAGFDGIGFTDHPAPSQRWLDAGGHDALDPFAALAFCAAVTERLRLIPNVVVLPYRNPFLVAKAAATVDVLSGGRFTLAAATGYQRSEFAALGVDFDERNELFDEALQVLRAVWAGDEVRFAGRRFCADGQTVHPKPSRVPIWIGGNSARARQRVADGADGWYPFPAPAAVARAVRTRPLEAPADLARLLDDLRRRLEAAGRDPASVDVSFVCDAGGTPGDDRFDAGARLEALAGLAGLGVTWVNVTLPAPSLAAALEAVQAYGEQVIAAERAG